MTEIQLIPFDIPKSGEIYILKCEKCAATYVGSTTIGAKNRLNQHKHKPISKMIAHNSACGNANLKIIQSIRVNYQNDAELRQKEQIYIEIVKPNLNSSDAFLYGFRKAQKKVEIYNKNYYNRTVAQKMYYCSCCAIATKDAFALTRHNKSRRHLAKIAKASN